MNNLNKFDQDAVNLKIRSEIRKNIILKFYAKTDSTNKRAKEFIKNNLQKTENKQEKIFVFAADQQLSGRGRRGHNWDSGDSASIYVSFLFKAEGLLEKTPQLTAAAALAVNKTLNDFNLENTIKWPNDIMAADKKICGILSELVLLKQRDQVNKKSALPFVVIGCGLNLNNSNFAAELTDRATSYYLEKGIKIDKNLFLAVLIENIYFYVKKYLSGARKDIMEKWKAKLNLKGKKVDLVFKNKSYTAIIKDILDSGEILVRLADGREKVMQSLNTSLAYQSLKKYNG